MTIKRFVKLVIIVIPGEQGVLTGEVHRRPHRPVFTPRPETLGSGMMFRRLYGWAELQRLASKIVFLLHLGKRRNRSGNGRGRSRRSAWRLVFAVVLLVG